LSQNYWTCERGVHRGNDQQEGFFEAAGGGTIFLDEFAEMSLTMQQRLLRVLQEGAVRPVGSTDPKEIEIDSRVIVATNHDLKRMFQKASSETTCIIESMCCRSTRLRCVIGGGHIDFGTHFVRKYNEKNVTRVSEQISHGVLAILEAYSWPGNVRELEKHLLSDWLLVPRSKA